MTHTEATSATTLQVPEEYRSKTDIKRSILEFLLEGPQSQTHVMYKGILSYKQLKAYQGWLEAQGLVEIGATDGKWRITGKGVRYVKALQKAEAILTEVPA